MEYVSLDDLRNTYPSPDNYSKTSINTIRLDGLYSPNNIEFEIPELSLLEIVDDTSFKFILELKFSEDDDEYIGLYTSPIFYNDLVTAYNEANPYVLQSAFIEQFTVKFYINELTKMYNQLTDIEIDFNVDVNRNIFYKSNDIHQYDYLVKYINWVISKPNLDEISKRSVLPVSEISEYSYAEYNIDTSQFDYVDDVINSIRLADLNNELSNINLTIADIEDYLKNPDSAKFRVPGSVIAKIVGPAGVGILNSVGGVVVKGIIAKIIPSVLLGPVGIIVGGVALITSVVTKLIGSAKKKKELEALIEQQINKLKAELIRLKERRILLQKEIEQLNG